MNNLGDRLKDLLNEMAQEEPENGMRYMCTYFEPEEIAAYGSDKLIEECAIVLEKFLGCLDQKFLGKDCWFNMWVDYPEGLLYVEIIEGRKYDFGCGINEVDDPKIIFRDLINYVLEERVPDNFKINEETELFEQLNLYNVKL